MTFFSTTTEGMKSSTDLSPRDKELDRTGSARSWCSVCAWANRLDELPPRLEAEERRVRAKVAAQLREELKGRTEASDSKRMEELVGTACEKARKEDAGYWEVQKEHDRAISHWECHYWGSARVYCLVGDGLAQAMKALLPKE